MLIVSLLKYGDLNSRPYKEYIKTKRALFSVKEQFLSIGVIFLYRLSHSIDAEIFKTYQVNYLLITKTGVHGVYNYP